MRSLIGGIRNARNPAPVPYAPTRTTGFNAIGGSSTQSGAPTAAHLATMGSVSTLSAIVGRTSEAVAGVDWRLYRKAAPGQPPESRTEITSHAALDLWSQPNPFMPRQEFVEVGQQHYELTGEEWWIVSKAGRLPLELWPVRPDRMRPVPSTKDFIAGYTYRSPDGDDIPLDAGEVIFIRRPNPLDPYRGMGVVQSLLVDLDSARFTAEWNRNFFVNSAEPGGIIMVDKRLSDDEFTEMVSRWREQHQGVAQAHRVAVLEQGQWIDRKYSMRDMQFKELRELSSEVIREGFGFPKPMLGTVTDTNRANAEAAEVVFARWVLVPRLERIKQALNTELLPMFGRTAAGLEFDYANPVPDDAELAVKELTARTQAYVLLTSQGGVTPESAADVCGLPAMDHAAPEQPMPGQPGAPGEDGAEGPSQLIDTTGQDRQDDVDWGLFGGSGDDEDEDGEDAGQQPADRVRAAWDPARHPRDRKGRFTASRTAKLTDAERDRARNVIAGFKPKTFADGAEADAYVMKGQDLPQAQVDAVDYYTGDAFLDINRKLRSGGDVSDDTTIKNLRAAMRPTEDDLILTRTVSFDAFPKGMNLEDLAGMKVKDAAFSSTSLGAAYGGSLGNIRMKIAVPKGTPAVFAAKYSRNPHEREIVLGDGLEFAVASVTKNDSYGYDVSLIVLPKSDTSARAFVREMGAALAPKAGHDHPHVVDAVPPPPLPDPPADGTPPVLPDDASTDVQPVQDAWDEALAAAVALWLVTVLGSDDDRARAAHGVAGVAGGLVAQVEAAVQGRDLLALTRLRPDPVLLQQAGDALGERLVDVGMDAARQAVAEAAAQGVTVGTGAVDKAALRATGHLSVATLADGLRITAAREAARVWGPGVAPDTVALHVAEALSDLTAAQPEYVIGGALTGAQAAGREATILAGPSAALYADATLDRNTCLAPETRVTTRAGLVYAKDVTLDDELLTHAGRWVRPSALVVSEVEEQLVRVDIADGRTLRLTHDHPVLVRAASGFEWRDAGELAVGDLVLSQPLGELHTELVSVDLGLGESPDGVAAARQVAGLPLVDVRAERVPVGAVRLDHDVADDEVHDPRTDLALRLGRVAERLEGQSDDALDAGLGVAGPVTAVPAVSTPGLLRRDDPEFLAAVLAFDEDRRSPAFLGTVAPSLTGAMPEEGTAPLAGGIDAPCFQTAGPGTVVVPGIIGSGYGEFLPAVGADLGDMVLGSTPSSGDVRVGSVAIPGAVDGTVLVGGPDFGTAHLAGRRRVIRIAVAPSMECPAGAASVPALFGADSGPAVDARAHDMILVPVTGIHREFHAGHVYDFTVPGDNTFHAEGVIVHNCPACRAIDRKWIGNSDDPARPWRALFPVRGYIACAGRDRCRCQIVATWRGGSDWKKWVEMEPVPEGAL